MVSAQSHRFVRCPSFPQISFVLIGIFKGSVFAQKEPLRVSTQATVVDTLLGFILCRADLLSMFFHLVPLRHPSILLADAFLCRRTRTSTENSCGPWGHEREEAPVGRRTRGDCFFVYGHPRTDQLLSFLTMTPLHFVVHPEVARQPTSQPFTLATPASAVGPTGLASPDSRNGRRTARWKLWMTVTVRTPSAVPHTFVQLLVRVF